jgi:hypothetical protein
VERAEFSSIQQRMYRVTTRIERTGGVPEDFIPWESGLSPSLLYSCSLPLRKKYGMKAPEVKWISIKRWISETSSGMKLPEGVFYSVKRQENFHAFPSPKFEKTEYVIIMTPNGNVTLKNREDEPLKEKDLWSQSENGEMYIEEIIRKDSESPIRGYIESCYSLFKSELEKENSGKDSILWIHTKRKKK